MKGLDYEAYKATYGDALLLIVIPILKMAQQGVKRADKPVFTALDDIIEKAADSQMETELNELFRNIATAYECHAANLATLRDVLRADFKRMKA